MPNLDTPATTIPTSHHASSRTRSRSGQQGTASKSTPSCPFPSAADHSQSHPPPLGPRRTPPPPSPSPATSSTPSRHNPRHPLQPPEASIPPWPDLLCPFSPLSPPSASPATST